MDENKLMLQFLSKKLGTNDPKKIQKYLKGLDKQKQQALAQEYQQWKESQKTQQAQKAAHGAKLQYIKSLKHICPEGEELVYYKKGGSVTCGCKKKEQGGEVQEAKCGAAAKFKKVKKGQNGPKNTLKFKDQAARDSFYINTYGAEDLESTRPGKNIPNKNYNPNDPNSKTHIWVPDRTKPPYNNKREEPLEPKKTIKQKVNNKKDQKEKEKSPRFKTMVMTKKGGFIVDKFKTAKCGSKLKKHLWGGSLNGIPFMQEGTPKGGIVLPEYMYKKQMGYPSILPGKYTGLEKITPGLFQMFKTWVKGLPKTLTPMDYISAGTGAATGIGLGYDDTHNQYVRKWITDTEKSLQPSPQAPSKPFIEFIKNNKPKFKK